MLHLTDSSEISRRDILGHAALGAAVLGVASILPMSAEAARVPMPQSGSFQISFRNQHTGESFSGAYRMGNRYLPEAFKRINVVLRDFRVNEIYPIDPRVIDILYMIRAKTGQGNRTFEVLSGYRSPRTNAMLRKASGGVARNSLHLTGQAIDFRLEGVSTKSLKQTACSLEAGGVGYYPRSNFVHVDTGRVRHWG